LLTFVAGHWPPAEELGLHGSQVEVGTMSDWLVMVLLEWLDMEWQLNVV
jgi:hypothetical protein